MMADCEPEDPAPPPATPEEKAEAARRVAELTPEELAGIHRMLAEPDDWDDG